MKKLLFLAVLLAAALYFLPAPLIKSAIQSGTGSAFGTNVSVAAVEVDLPNSRFNVEGYSVDNPPGFDSRHFIRLDEGYAVLNAGSLFDDVIEVPEINVTGMNLYLEQKGTRTNFKEMLSEMAKRTAGQSATNAGNQPQDTDLPLPDLNGKRFIVRNLHIGEGRVHIKTPRGTTESNPLPTITLTDIGSASGGVTLAELSTVATRALVDSATGSARFQPPKTEQNPGIQHEADDLMGQLKAATASAWKKASAYWDPIGAKLQSKLDGWEARYAPELKQITRDAIESGKQSLEGTPSPLPAPDKMPPPGYAPPPIPGQMPPPGYAPPPNAGHSYPQAPTQPYPNPYGR